MSDRKGIPSKTSPEYKAGHALFVAGPQKRSQVYLLANFGQTEGLKSAGVTRALRKGWFIDLPGDGIGLSDRAHHYYAGTEPEPKQMGSLATPRENLHAMQPLSRKHFLNVKGTRLDAPDCSIQAKPSHFGKVTP